MSHHTRSCCYNFLSLWCCVISKRKWTKTVCFWNQKTKGLGHS
jgi:hypothetical protein